MTYLDIIDKLIGPIIPIGESGEDSIRYENLEVFCSVIEGLIDRVRNVGSYKNSYEYFADKAGTYAKKFLTNLKEEL